ncbi:discoidin domain-containing protein [Paenibacillus sp.]|uniref:CBM96 family carbohydrate-binding protein n=1 Tax=Paenibacillus sp. TaxID=58172 RepID=UPI00281239A6|nr:discoidin domain-containing protein [Paenibacillus sp.]
MKRALIRGTSVWMAVCMAFGLLPTGASMTEAADATGEESTALFRYDFENDAVGSPPTVNAEQFDAWTAAARSAESPLTVVEDNGGKALEYARVETATGGGGPRVEKRIDVAGRETLTVEFQMKTLGHRFMLELRGEGQSPPVTRLLLLDGNGLVPTPPEGAVFDRNAYVDAKIEIDAAGRTFTSYLNGYAIQSDVPLHADIDLSKPIMLRFTTSVQPGERLYLDNVVITGAMTEAEASAIVRKLSPAHPRLMATADDFAALAARIGADPRSAEWYGKIRAEAERFLAEPPSEYGFPDGRTLLNVSRQVLSRSYALALAYRIEGDAKYAERLWTELEAAAAFPDWNPESFLSAAEMTHAFAIGYDWAYDYWSPERKDAIRDAIVRLGLTPGLNAYRSGAWWVSTTNNWNLVCNSGLAIGALAIGDEEPELAEAILQAGLASIPRALGEYAPDGAYPEGVTYWAYANRYFVPYLASLQTAVGETFGLAETPGLADTGSFPIYMTGPSGLTFNYYDASASAQRPAEMFWFAETYGRPEYAWWGEGSASASPTQLLWYEPGAALDPREAGLSLDKRFRRSEAASFRSAWDASDALYVGWKAGDNAFNHGDLDLGTFVLDALGARWASELGSEDYGSPGYWSAGPNGQRWTYYRKRAEGQNTLVVNPGAGDDQDPRATGEIVRFESGPTEAFAVAELSEAYAHVGATSWQRGISLFDHRRQVLVQDELQADEPADVWWFMHTPAAIEAGADGRSAILTIGGERMLARIVSPAAGAAFTIMDAEPLWTSPDPQQSPNNSVRKLAIHLEGVTDLRLAVQFTPLRDGGPAAEAADVTPLSAWDVAHDAVPTLSDIALGGVPLAAFAPGAFTYDVPLAAGATAAPTVTATAVTPTDTVDVEQASTPDGAATILVSRAGGPTTRYEVHFQREASSEEGPVVTASIQGTFPPEHTIDDDLTTFFSAQGYGQWVQYDLGESTSIDGVSLAWYQGDVRSFAFTILASEDGETWTEAYAGSSNGTLLELEAHAFPAVEARYVRIVGYGNSSNQWMSITEARLHTEAGVWPAFETRAPVLERVELTAEYERSAVGETGRLGVSGILSDGGEADLAQAQVRYGSSDASVAAVGVDGELTFVGAGEATLYVVVESADRRLKYDRLTVQVVDPNTRLPVADAFVRGGSYGDDRYGTSSGMTLKQDANADFYREAYLAIDVGAIDGPLEAATLYIYASVSDQGTGAGASGHAIDVHALAGEWQEHTVTWNTRPTVLEKLASVGIDDVFQWRAIELPVEAVEAAEGGRLDVALRHVAPAGNRYAVSVRSREHATYGPYLVLTPSATVEAVWSPEAPDGREGWYASPVTLTLLPPDAAEARIEAVQSTDGSTPPTDGFAPYTDPILFADGVYDVEYRAVGGEAAGAVRVMVDTEAPTVTVSTYGIVPGDAGGMPVATIDAFVRIVCEASDELSGVAVSSCASPLVEAEAYELSPGEHTAAAEATDAAGHTRTVETAFVVAATTDGLVALTERFVAAMGAPGAGGIAEALTKKLGNAGAAIARGDAEEADALLQAYKDQLAALSGVKLTASQAETLAFWASQLQGA